jgi:putative FmdB family regulatory protein
MPIYVYRAAENGCDVCRENFEVLQQMSDDKLTECPECGTEVEKQVVSVNSTFPKGPAALRTMGMARLEKRSDGSYENVSAQPGEQRHGSLDSFSDSLTKGPKKIVSD